MGKLLKLTLIGVLLGFLAERFVHFAQRGGFHVEVENKDLPNCQYIKGVEYGSEDLHLLPNGLAFFSSGLKVPLLKSFAPDRPAEILLVDLNQKNLQAVPLKLSEGFDVASFNPHGISVHIDEKDGTVFLFVVNHPSPEFKTKIEIFKFVEEKNLLVHVRSIVHPGLQSINDLVAVGPESFYATNDSYFHNMFLKFLEMFLGLTWTNIVYYSPLEVREVVSGLHSANGMAMSQDKKFIYAVDLTAHTINVYKRNPNWSLSFVKEFDCGTLVDNLWVDPDTGDIWTGAHPNLFKVFNYKDEDPPGSEVIRVQNIHSANPIISRVYVNNGSVLQGSSCAAIYKGKMIVGTVFHKALYCPWTH